MSNCLTKTGRREGKSEWQCERKNSFIICEEVFKVHLKIILSNKD